MAKIGGPEPILAQVMMRFADGQLVFYAGKAIGSAITSEQGSLDVRVSLLLSRLDGENGTFKESDRNMISMAMAVLQGDRVAALQLADRVLDAYHADRAGSAEGAGSGVGEDSAK